jgi:TPR repeat protein
MVFSFQMALVLTKTSHLLFTLSKLSIDQNYVVAQNNYSFLLENDTTTEQDKSFINYYYNFSADQNNTVAQFRHRFLFENDDGIV